MKNSCKMESCKPWTYNFPTKILHKVVLGIRENILKSKPTEYHYLIVALKNNMVLI